MYSTSIINQTILFLLIFLMMCVKISISSSSKNDNDDDDDEMSVKLKRSLYTDYLKNQPMSKDLQDFIDKYRNKRQENSGEKRSKRSQIAASAMNDENQLYIVQNGQLIPLKDLKNFKREEDGAGGGKSSFRVVPLVVPIHNGNIKNTRVVQARNLDMAAAALVAPTTSPPPPEASSAAAAAATTLVSTSVAAANAASSSESPASAPEGGGDENGANNGTQEETQVLNKILKDIEGLMQWKHSNGNKKEGVICSVNGSWISDAAGMRFDINFKNSSRKKFRIHVADRIPPNEEGFLCDGNWSVFGELPFSHSGVVIVLAVHSKDKHLAMFIGECRVCEGSETVSGTWMIGRSSRDCKDQKASHKVLSDIWKKEEAHLLRKKHLKQLGIATNDNDD